MTKMGSASKTHSQINHRSERASLKVSKRDVVGIEASKGPSGPISGSGKGWDCRLRVRRVIVAFPPNLPPPPLLAEVPDRVAAIAADSGAELGEF